ncbi:ADP-ribose pyrophosphatase YjhB (NUDIX family) [Actinocorallia herbida]|uniref:ADP-ribose pyrophosphatase YjhB (NUDIX family) n=1 Tax=Actinocorallia herbida TaxID=58109 RepID=A0A3N1DBG4_9ACTN|nr:NUDIX domain-containing protein [Actinocorallia herbida]ROO90861.1 ADP-ribose pyrophosphatase YjhB (NUDIX family) [Actinocorallia herbida]
MFGVYRVYGVLRKIWRTRWMKRLHWRLLWSANATFMCGITGVVRTEDGRVLLLRHRFWPDGRQWGFPTGYAKKGERHEDTIAREVREETGLTVEVGRLLQVNSGYRLRIEIIYEAVLRGGLESLALDPREILEARLFALDELPEAIQPAHRLLARL